MPNNIVRWLRSNQTRPWWTAALFGTIIVVIASAWFGWIPPWAALSASALWVAVCLWLLARLRPNQTGIWWTVALLGGIGVVVDGARSGWIPPWAAFSSGALWVVICIWLLAVIDLLATRGKAIEDSYTPLPFGFARLNWLAPFSIPIGFAIGLYAGHNWW